ncbi:MAG: metallophosphoesterase family protein [Anaerolineae bacterium]
MTKIAVISDIHANIHALEATIRDLQRIGTDQVIVNGDLVGRGPYSEAVLERVQQMNWTVIRGNHEEFWAQCGHGNLPPEWEESWWKPTRQQIESMDPRWFDWMDTLPDSHIIRLPDVPAVQVVHGSPRKNNEGLYDNVPDASVLEALDSTPYRVVVGGHTHVPMIRTVGPYQVLNCGSVGAPFNGNPSAQYLLLHWRDHAWHFEIRCVPYDHEAALREWRACGYLASGVAAQIFAYELETATFHFWHYVRFCEAFELSYSLPASFNRYRREFPAFRRYCEVNALPLHKIESLITFRDRQASPPPAHG